MVDKAPTNDKATLNTEVECVTTNASAVEGDKQVAPVVAAVGSEETSPVDLNAIAPAAGPAEVCEIPGRKLASAEDLANAILVTKPAAGETKTYAAVGEGQTYNFDFNYKDALVENEGKNVVIRFADGSVVILEDFAGKASQTKLIVDNCEAEPIQFASLNNIAPAAGAAPAAAGPQANSAPGNSGAGFTPFDAGNLPGVGNPLGPQGGTSLNYGLIDGLRPEASPPRIDGRPTSFNGGNPLGTLDETDAAGGTGGFGGPLTTTGTINFNYGSDGAGSVRIIAGPTGLTHHGEPISTSVSADGHTATGTTPDGTVVFIFTIDPATGTYTYTQVTSLDHPIAGDPNEFLDLPFVIRVTDADGDYADGTATIRVYDDAPSAVTNAGNSGVVDETDGATIGVSGNLTFNYGGDGAGSIKLVGGPSGLTSGGQPVVVTVTDGVVTGSVGGTTVFTLTLNQTTGAWSYQQFAPLDHGDVNNPDDVLNLGFTVRVTDYDGDFVDTPISITVHDDGPSIDKSPVTQIDETNGFGSVSGVAPFHFGQDGPGEVRLNGGPTGLTSHGQPITVSLSADGTTATGTTASGTVVFTLTLNPTTGTYTFSLLAPLDHPVAGNPNDALNLDFGFTVTDGDGDSVAGNIGVVVLDDGPTAGTASIGVADLGTMLTGTLPFTYGTDGAGSIKLGGSFAGLTSGGQPVLVTVSGSSIVGKLADGTVVFSLNVAGDHYSFVQNADLDGNPTLSIPYTVTDYDGDTAEGCIVVETRVDGLPTAGVTTATVDETGGFDTVSGQLPFSYGPDGAGSIKLTTGPSGLTSGGQAVIVTVSADGKSVTGVTAGGVSVFTLTINSTGGYTFTQHAALDHPNTSNHNDTLGLGFGFVVSDADGDVATGALNVTVYDDGPTAGNVSVTAVNGSDVNGSSVSGNLPYGYGMDGAGSVKLTGVSGNYTVDGRAVTVTVTNGAVTGTLADGTKVFSLTFNGTSYTYAQFKNLDGSPKLDFTYQVTDRDGDKATGHINVQSSHDGVPTAGVTTATVDETGGFDTVSGNLAFNYGPDGAGNVTFTSLPTGLTSHGTPVISVLSNDGYTITGMANGVKVFTLTITNPTTGAYTFTQHAPLDHPNSSNPDDQLPLNFGFHVADRDGDTADGTLTVIVKDDGPTAGNSCSCGCGATAGGASGTLPFTYGADGPGSVKLTGVSGSFTSDGQPVTITAGATSVVGKLADGTVVFTFTLTDATYTYMQFANLDGKPLVQFNFSVSDYDGDTANGSVCVQSRHVDGVPTASVTMVSVDETGGLDSVSGNLAYNYGPDGAGTVAFIGGPTGLISQGKPVTISISADGLTITGTAGGVAVFTATITNPATGAYTFTQLAPLDHPNTGNYNDALNLSFGFRVTDRDGDSATGSLNVTVYDDGPTIGNVTLAIDETSAKDTVGSLTDGLWATPQSGTPLVVSGTLNANFGQDGKGSIQLVGTPSALSHHGQPVVVTSVDGGAVGKLADGTVIFKLNLKADGSFSFEQFGSLDHPNTNDHNDLLSLGFTVKITDGDGDSATGNITIRINDDGPTAGNEEFCIDQSLSNGASPMISTTGQIGLNYGMDGQGFITVGTPTNGQITVDGQAVSFTVLVNATGQHVIGRLPNGETAITLDVRPDGSYTYKQYVFVDTVDGKSANLQIGYTIYDGDNDCDTGTINICFTGGPDGQPTAEIITISVDETGGLDSVSGNLPYSFGPDGAGSVTFTTVPTGLTSKGVPVVVTLSADGLTATGMAGGVTVFKATITNPATGAYTFTQHAVLDHPNTADHNDTLKLGFGFTVTDRDGDTANGALNVVVYDDGPSAGSASIGGATVGSGAVTGTLPASYGLDGAGSIKLTGGVSGLTSAGQPVTVTVTSSGAVGKLADGSVVFTLTLNGSSYSYVQSKTLDGNPSFGLGYVVKDGDGDTATGTITIKATTKNGLPEVGVSENTVVDETGGFDTVSGALNYQYGADGAGAVKFVGGPTGLTSHGVAVTISISADGKTLVGKAGNVDVFKAVIDTGTGKYTFTQLAALDHPNAADHNDALDLRFNFQVSDRDGDVAEGFFKVKVYDDGPQISGSPVVTLDESNARDTVGSPTDGIWATPTSGTPLVGTGKVAVNFGMDGGGSVQIAGGPTSLTHHGQAITVSMSGGTATGKLANGTVIFTMVVANDGSFTFKQYGSIDHPNAADHNDPLSFGFTVKVTDYDGDSATTTVGVTIRDDGPQALDEDVTIDQCAFVDDGSSLTPLVVVNGALDFGYGNDGAGSLKVHGLKGAVYSCGEPVQIVISETVAGAITTTNILGKLASGETVFTLTVQPDGTYAYKQYGVIDSPSDSTVLNFSYTVTDADNDTDLGAINIRITGTYTDPSEPPSIYVQVVHNSNNGVVVSDLSVRVTDPDSTHMSGANVNLHGRAGDLLTLSSGFSVVGLNVLHNGVDTGIDFTRLGNGGFQLSGNGTIDLYQNILDSVQLHATGNQSDSRNISFSVTDDTGLSSGVSTVNFYPSQSEASPAQIQLAALAEDEETVAQASIDVVRPVPDVLQLAVEDEQNYTPGKPTIPGGGPEAAPSVLVAEGHGEKLDISQILEGHVQTHDDLASYVKVESIDGNTVVSVDSTGTGSNFTEVAIFTGVTGVTLDSMIADGSLEVGRFHS